MSILAEICEHKRKEVADRKLTKPEEELKIQIQERTLKHCFKKRLTAFKNKKKPAVIAEIKKASPSAGLICPNFDPRKIAQSYSENGAACLSVLTDEKYFQGQDCFIKSVKEVCDLPVLRKDFMIDPYQVVESKALGADCILIIMAAIDDGTARDIKQTATEFGMDALIEVHDMEELERAKKLDPDIIGVNSRNLKTQTTDFTLFDKIAPHIPDHCLKIAESGIKTRNDIQKLLDLDYTAFLIGEAFMRQDDPGLALRNITTLP